MPQEHVWLKGCKGMCMATKVGVDLVHARLHGRAPYLDSLSDAWLLACPHHRRWLHLKCLLKWLCKPWSAAIALTHDGLGSPIPSWTLFAYRVSAAE